MKSFGVDGALTGPVAGRDVGWLLDRWATRQPDREFLTWVPFDGPLRSWTWGAFARDVAAVQASFAARGIRPGDPVALVLPNHPDFLLAWTALTGMGAVAVCLNPGSSVDEFGYVAGHSGPMAAVVCAEVADVVAAGMPDLRWIAVSGGAGPDRFDVLLKSEPMVRQGVVGPRDAASIQYTSGTTARPKGVVWTQANCLWAGRVGAAHQGLTPSDVNLIHLPLFHTNALSYSFLSSLWSGGRIVLQPKFSASRFWPVASAHGATWSSVVSFCLRALADKEVPVRHEFRGWGNSFNLDPSPATGGVPVVGWFGMTETVSHPIVGDLLHPDPPRTMGRAATEYQVRVVDDLAAPVGAGGAGELQVRGVPGVSLFREYLHDAAATEKAFTADGWFVTGDRVGWDRDGSFTFLERDKDVLKVGGENIGAPEIERVLLGVAGVHEAAVVGRPDTMLGEVPIAFVTIRPGAAVDPHVLEAACRMLLAAYKQPREIRIVTELPRSTLDKVAKSRLRDLLAAEVSGG